VVVVSLAVLIVEIGIIAAIGVGLSGLIARPLFSVAATYLVVSALVFGTLIAFGLGATAFSSEATTTYRPAMYNADGSPQCVDGGRLLERSGPHGVRRPAGLDVHRAAVRPRLVGARGQSLRHPR
jgi:hypothetical protein